MQGAAGLDTPGEDLLARQTLPLRGNPLGKARASIAVFYCLAGAMKIA
jgi:hypothetical protein